jgi:hypothetical protein
MTVDPMQWQALQDYLKFIGLKLDVKARRNRDWHAITSSTTLGTEGVND